MYVIRWMETQADRRRKRLCLWSRSGQILWYTQAWAWSECGCYSQLNVVKSGTWTEKWTRRQHLQFVLVWTIPKAQWRFGWGTTNREIVVQGEGKCLAKRNGKAFYMMWSHTQRSRWKRFLNAENRTSPLLLDKWLENMGQSSKELNKKSNLGS